jgi:hypothetical protein
MKLRGARIRALGFCGLWLIAWAPLGAQQGQEAKDFGPVSLALTDGSVVRGVLLSAEAEKITLRVGNRERTFQTEKLKPVSVAVARRKTIDPKDARALFELGLWCRQAGLIRPGDSLMAQAVSIDPAYAQRRREVLEAQVGAQREVSPAPHPAGAPGDPDEESRKFKPADEAQIRAHRQIAEAWARQVSKEISGDLHRVETAHFVIYSTWPESDDKPLRRVCEALYDRLLKQFDLKASESVWAGKLPLFVFRKAEHFQQFATRVDKVALRVPDMVKAGGYHSRRGDFCYVVLNGLEKVHASRRKTRFFHVLVHETTHAFMARYVSARNLPKWLNEGLAEYMAKELVPKSLSANAYASTTRKALREGIDINPVFQGVPLDPFWYGISHSLLRYLVHRDAKALPELVTQIKEGTAAEEALRKSYGLDYAQLQNQWRKAATSRER